MEAAGRRALVIRAELSDLDAAAGLAGAAVEEFGRLDIVVNNVGGAMLRPFPATKPRHLEAAFHFNVAVAHALTQAAVPHLLAAAGAAEGGSRAASEEREGAGQTRAAEGAGAGEAASAAAGDAARAGEGAGAGESDMRAEAGPPR